MAKKKLKPKSITLEYAEITGGESGDPCVVDGLEARIGDFVVVRNQDRMIVSSDDAVSEPWAWILGIGRGALEFEVSNDD